jgi:predicted HD superfamily hydrolase involved in NAD metabolism
MSDYADIFADARRELENRLTQYRLLHSLSVADVSTMLANAYDVDIDDARIAGLLHDWDKNHTDEELIERARRFNIKVPTGHEGMAALLHAQTGAAAVSRRYPDLTKSVIQAISRHTSAAPDMSDLDMIIYVADMIEPMRSQSKLQPLREMAGNVPLDTLFLKCYESTMSHLISRHRFIHPDSLKVWNAYVAGERQKRQDTQ